jgi:RNA polymerase sigma factor (sigma-70 family)
VRKTEQLNHNKSAQSAFLFQQSTLHTTENINNTIDHLFRHESGKMISVLSKLLGLRHLERAEDIVQDTLLQAMTTWSFKGVPDNPSGWLYRVAKNKAIDFLRRERKFKELSPQYSRLLESEYSLTPTLNQLFLNDGIEDSQLRMIFACCHPSIAQESQAALALKTLCGLSVTEIARAFLTNEETVAKRIYRAREKIRTENIELEIPSNSELIPRLNSVLQCLYLLFNEGYNSSHPDQLIREELCQEAMRLNYLLANNQLTNRPRTRALLALMCFQASRLHARLDDKGNIILLKQQDRSKWFRPLMEKGFYFMENSLEEFESSDYHFEAAIASLHASAKSFEETDWKSICFLYERLYELKPGPVVALNRAIAFAYAGNKKSALDDILAIKGLEKYYLYPTSIGELYYELGNKNKAIEYYEAALKLTSSKKERQLLENKISNCY